ncbi:hypothetical protein HN018_01740 [Lichenicola cladoniae]|uniref:Uncharacterized protein n=1 Tax=Lichenicola cladoniae TaxID=1484109 RepID=A0A6M8HJK9_9PROT|nr:hypothetical protein [Lichenicola cladoniae]NPD68585.1 hypothetical protein [Acetobacteraceae bacterium]QKE88938.1 hypothetical protein HN018_01740 [Lichenicola cladoniae]
MGQAQMPADVLTLRTPMTTLFLGPLDDRGLASLRTLTVLGGHFEQAADMQARAALGWVSRDAGQMNALRGYLARHHVAGAMGPLTDTAIIEALRRSLVEHRLGMIACDVMTPHPAQLTLTAGGSHAAAAPRDAGPGAKVAAKPQPVGVAADVGHWSTRKRLTTMAGRAFKRIPGEVGRQIQGMLTPENLLLLDAGLLALIIAQGFGVGEVVDAVLVAMAIRAAGWSGMIALVELSGACVKAARATSDATLDAAADSAAEALAVLGVLFVTMLITKMAKRATSGGGEASGGGAPDEPPEQTVNPNRGQGVGGKAARGPTVTENAAKGKAFEAQGLEHLETTQTNIQDQVSVRPYLDNGDLADYRVRLDAISRDDTNTLRLTDFKSSESAGLTPRQTTGYPLLGNNGGQVVGNGGGADYPAGFQIPPTNVDVLRPGDF